MAHVVTQNIFCKTKKKKNSTFWNFEISLDFRFYFWTLLKNYCLDFCPTEAEGIPLLI